MEDSEVWLGFIILTALIAGSVLSGAVCLQGDRMWTFAVALYLVEIQNNSLRLTAVFGFALTISVMLFGALVGKWVDRTPRLSGKTRDL